MPELLSIGTLAQMAEVNVETIRYYQRRGLLGVPQKPPGGHRRYTAEFVKRLRFIKRAQALGFTLAEVAALLRLDSMHQCAETRALANRKLLLIEDKLADLAAMRQAMMRLMQQCDSSQDHDACPLLDALSHG